MLKSSISLLRRKPAPVTVTSKDELAAPGTWTVLLSPQGRRLTDAGVRELAGRDRLLLLCGRYEGIDERVRRTVVDEEISIGAYVLSGGEVAAMAVIERWTGVTPQPPSALKTWPDRFPPWRRSLPRR